AACQHHVEECGEITMINRNALRLAGATGSEQQIAKIISALIDGFQCRRARADTVVQRPAFGSAKLARAVFLVSIEKQSDARIPDNSHIPLNGTVITQGHVTRAARQNCEERGIRMNRLFSKNPYTVAALDPMGLQKLGGGGDKAVDLAVGV